MNDNGAQKFGVFFVGFADGKATDGDGIRVNTPDLGTMDDAQALARELQEDSQRRMLGKHSLFEARALDASEGSGVPSTVPAPPREPEPAAVDEVTQVPPVRLRRICIVIDLSTGEVQGDLDDETALWPVGTESTAESTTIDGQARSILDQALHRILGDELGNGAVTEP